MSWLREEPARLVLVAVYFSFVVGWSSIALWRFYSFNAGIFDLGVVMERGWLIYHTAWTLESALKVLFDSGILFVVFPITIPQNYPLLLVFQVAEVGASAFPLYGIARHFKLEPVVSLLIAGSFLAYFPLNGTLWFDVHYQTLFMVLFLSGYYCYLKGNLVVAGILLGLSGTVRFPYAIFPLLFGAWIVAASLAPRLFAIFDRPTNQWRFGASLAGVALVFLAGGILIGSPSPVVSSVGAVGPVPIGGDLAQKLVTVLFFMGPVLLIPFCSPKWILFLLPYGFLVFLSGSGGYFVPAIYQGAYPSGVAPFVFLGLIEGLPRALRFVHRRRADTLPRREGRTWRRPVDSFELVAVSTAAVVLAALFLTPYGPFNQYTSTGYAYDLYSAPGPNFTQFHEVENVIGFIPATSPYIIAQEELPELFPRPLAQPTLPVVNPVLPTFPTNITEGEIINNTIPINVDNAWQTTRADYVVGDPYLWTMYTNSPSIMGWMQLMYDSGHFGIVAEESEITLLARDYSGPVKAFVPWSDELGSHNVTSPSAVAMSDRGSSSGVNHSIVWSTPSDLFVPGTYRVSAEVWVSNASCSMSLQLTLHDSVSGHSTNLTSEPACDLIPNQWNWISATADVTGMWESLAVVSSFSSGSGGMMSEATLTETGPPTNSGVV